MHHTLFSIFYLVTFDKSLILVKLFSSIYPFVLPFLVWLPSQLRLENISSQHRQSNMNRVKSIHFSNDAIFKSLQLLLRLCKKSSVTGQMKRIQGFVKNVSSFFLSSWESTKTFHVVSQFSSKSRQTVTTLNKSASALPKYVYNFIQSYLVLSFHLIFFHQFD